MKLGENNISMSLLMFMLFSVITWGTLNFFKCLIQFISLLFPQGNGKYLVIVILRSLQMMINIPKMAIQTQFSKINSLLDMLVSMLSKLYKYCFLPLNLRS